MSANLRFPLSCKEEIDGLSYFKRMCDKIRLHAAGELDSDYHPNLGKGFDLWICQLLKVDYSDLAAFVTENNADDRAALDWCYKNGAEPESPIKDWWCSYARNRGINDDLSAKLKMRKADAGFSERDDIQTFFDFIDAEEGR